MTIQRFRANARLYSRRLSTPTEPYYFEPGSIADLDVGYVTPETQVTPDEIEMLIGNGYISRVTPEEIAAWDAERAELEGMPAPEVAVVETPVVEELPPKAFRAKSKPIISDMEG